MATITLLPRRRKEKKKKKKKKKRKKERWPAQTKKNKIKGRGNIPPPPPPPPKKKGNLKRYFRQSRKFSSSLNFLSIFGRKHQEHKEAFLSIKKKFIFT